MQHLSYIKYGLRKHSFSRFFSTRRSAPFVGLASYKGDSAHTAVLESFLVVDGPLLENTYVIQ